MKVNLVVASGAHEGKVIPLTGSQFLIGRDEQCHLRPASQAISKLHCAVLVRDRQVVVKDFGSTNGTMVNDTLVQGAEVVIEDGATLRVGPLDFRVKIEKPAAKPDGTPFPAESATTIAAVKAAKAASEATSQDATPNPVRPGTPSGTVTKPGARPATKSGVVPKPGTSPTEKPVAPNKPGGSKEGSTGKIESKESAPLTTTSESITDEDQERIAAMLLGMDDSGNSSVPDGSTVMDIPSPLAGGDTAETGKEGEKKEDDKPKKAQTREEMSTAANDLLRKYMRRPK